MALKFPGETNNKKDEEEEDGLVFPGDDSGGQQDSTLKASSTSPDLNFPESDPPTETKTDTDTDTQTQQRNNLPTVRETADILDGKILSGEIGPESKSSQTAQRDIDQITDTEDLNAREGGQVVAEKFFEEAKEPFGIPVQDTLGKAIDSLSKTNFFQEAAQGIDIAEKEAAEPDTPDLEFDVAPDQEEGGRETAASTPQTTDKGTFERMGDAFTLEPENIGGALETTKELGPSIGRFAGDAVDLFVASGANFATRGIWGEGNPVGNLYKGISEKVIEQFETETSKEVAQQEFGMEKIKNPDFWTTTVARQVPQTLAFLRAAQPAYSSAYNKTKAFMGDSRFAEVASQSAGGLAGTAATRPFEGASEAEATYEQARDMGMSDEEAVGAGREVFVDNMKLAGVDAVQIAAALSPVKMQRSSALSKILSSTAKLGAGGVTEAGEEVWQERASRQALGQEFSLSDPQVQEAGFIGGMMGVAFQGAGEVSNQVNRSVQRNYMDRVASFLPDTYRQRYREEADDTVEGKREVLDQISEEDTKAVEFAVKAHESDQQAKAKRTQEAIEQMRQFLDKNTGAGLTTEAAETGRNFEYQDGEIVEIVNQDGEPVTYEAVDPDGNRLGVFRNRKNAQQAIERSQLDASQEAAGEQKEEIIDVEGGQITRFRLADDSVTFQARDEEGNEIGSFGTRGAAENAIEFGETQELNLDGDTEADPEVAEVADIPESVYEENAGRQEDDFRTTEELGLDVSDEVAEVRERNSSARLRHNEALQRIAEGDLGTARSIARRIPEFTVEGGGAVLFRDIESRIEEVDERLGIREEKEKRSTEREADRLDNMSREDLEAELQETLENAEGFEDAMGRILTSLERAEAGERIRGSDGEYRRDPSTFPDWIPDGTRKRRYVDMALEMFSFEDPNIRYPDNPQGNRQRQFVDAMFQELSDELGVDTDTIRGAILNTFDETTGTSQTPEEAREAVQDEGDVAEEAAEAFGTNEEGLTLAEEELFDTEGENDPSIDQEMVGTEEVRNNGEQLKRAVKTQENAQQLKNKLQREIKQAKKRINEAEEPNQRDILIRNDSQRLLTKLEKIEERLPTEQEFMGEDSQQLPDQETTEGQATAKQVRDMTEKRISRMSPFVGRKRESTLLKERIRNYARGVREGRSDQRQETENVQDFLIGLLEDSSIPNDEISKFRRTIKNIQTRNDLQKNLEDVNDRVERLVEMRKKREAKRQIKKELKKDLSRTTKSGGNRGTMTVEAQRKLKQIKNIWNMTQDEAATELEKMILDAQEEDGGTDEMFNMNMSEDKAQRARLLYLSAGEGTAKSLNDLLIDIQNTRETGQVEMNRIKANRQGKEKRMRDEFVRSITDGEGLDAGTGMKKDEGPDTTFDWMENFFKFTNSFEDYALMGEFLMDKLSKNDTSTEYKKGPMIEWFSQVHEKRETKNRAKEAIREDMIQAITDIFNVEKDSSEYRQLVSRLISEERVVGTYEDQNVDTKDDTFKLKLDVGEIMYHWAQMQNEQMREKYEQEKQWGEEVQQDIEDSLSEQEKAFAEYALNEFFPGIRSGEIDGIALDPIYEKQFFTELGTIDNYIPLRTEENVPSHIQMMRDEMSKVSAQASATKRRTNAGEVKIGTNLIGVMGQHAEEVVHFKAFSEFVNQGRRLFDGDVRTAIRQNFSDGDGMLKKIDTLLDDMANDGATTGQTVEWLDKVRGNTYSAFVGLNLVASTKQFGSIAGWWAETPGNRFFADFADFWKAPREKGRFLIEESQALRDRFDKGAMDRDMQQAVESGDAEILASRLNKLRDVSLILTKLNDRVAITSGGWSKYLSTLKEQTGTEPPSDVAKLKDFIKENRTAHKKAIKEFERSMKRTQQAADVENVSQIRRMGSIGDLFTIFMSGPEAQFNNSVSTLRAMGFFGDAKRISTYEGIKRYVTFTAVIPMILRFIADGFEWETREQVATIGASFFTGGLSFYPLLAGDLVQTGARKTAGLPTFPSGVPAPISIIAEAVDESGSLLNRLFVSDEAITLGEVFQVADEAVLALTQASTGIPANKPYDIAKSVYQKSMGEDVDWRRFLGVSEFSLTREFEDDDENDIDAAF